jgi:hypothetical protein
MVIFVNLTSKLLADNGIVSCHYALSAFCGLAHWLNRDPVQFIAMENVRNLQAE